MAVVFTHKLKPKLFDVKGARQIVRKHMRRNMTVVKNEFKKTTATWNNEKPTFITREQIRKGLGEVGFAVGPSGDTKGASKWMWLNEGTDVRYGIMTRNFIPKTRVGRLASGAGRGGLAYVDPSRPQDGIEARRWTDIIEKNNASRFLATMDAALDELLAK